MAKQPSNIELKDSISLILFSTIGTGLVAFSLAFGFNIFRITDNTVFQILLGVLPLILAFFLSVVFFDLLGSRILMSRCMRVGIVISHYKNNPEEEMPYISIITYIERFVSNTLVLLILLFFILPIWSEPNTIVQFIYTSLATLIGIMHFFSYRKKTSEQYLQSKIYDPFRI